MHSILLLGLLSQHSKQALGPKTAFYVVGLIHSNPPYVGILAQPQSLFDAKIMTPLVLHIPKIDARGIL